MMKSLLRLSPYISVAVLALLAACGGDSKASPTERPATAATAGATPASDGGAEVVRLSLQNHGGDMEGHTPRGFQGMGPGLFAGDNLNPNFPDGDGVQMFLTFDLGEVPNGKVESAVLSSEPPSVTGTPFEDLGSLTVEEVRYARFSRSLWNLDPTVDGASCTLAESASGPFQCDLSRAVQRSLDDSYRYAQFRVRFDEAGDFDGNQDLAAFFKRNSNTNEAGIFRLDVTVDPD